MRPRRPLLWLFVVFVLLSLMYLWATPPLEASDELWHFGLVNYIANTGELPIQIIGNETPWEQEGSQPPLYYLIAAALSRPVDRSDFDAVRQPNPHAIAGIPGAVGNKNLVLHNTPHPPPQGTVLAVYILRLFGIALGCVTVSAVYVSTRQLEPSHKLPALLAAGLTAFNPMFLFITASVNNDNLVIALGSLTIWQMLIMLRSGFNIRRSGAIAVLIALASLTKLSGLVLIPALAVAALWLAFRQRDWRGLLTLVALMVVAWALLAGWWYLRNLTLYGELFGTRTMAAVAGTRDGGFTLQTLLDEFQGFRFTFWGVFGAVNIMTFRWFYDVMDIVTLLALAGLLLRLWQVRSNLERAMPILLLKLILFAGTIGVIAWTAQTYASQGRLLFPYLAAISPLFALGLVELFQRIARRLNIQTVYFAVAMMLLLSIFALIVPSTSIAPAYAPPAPMTSLPEQVRMVYARYDGTLLVGYETPDLRYRPGDFVPITVYWQVLEPSKQDLSLYLHAVVNGGVVIGKVDSYPGGGGLQTTTWMPGAIYADTYAIPLDRNPGGEASQLRVQVGWWDERTGGLVEPVEQEGRTIESVMLDAGAFADNPVMQSTDDLEPLAATFGGLFALRGFHLNGDSLVIAWDVLVAPPEDYIVFVQVLDDAGNVVGQGDAPPAMPTRYWHPGESFLTKHTIIYPQQPGDGEYHLFIGWYRPDDFSRLETDAPDNAFLLKTLTLP